MPARSSMLNLGIQILANQSCLPDPDFQNLATISRLSDNRYQTLGTKIMAKSILAIAVLVLVGYFGIFVLPGIIRESNWQSLQAMCAEQVGYQSPDDNNNPQISTGESPDEAEAPEKSTCA